MSEAETLKFSPRSRKSLETQFSLEAQLSNLDAAIGNVKPAILELERRKSRLLCQVSEKPSGGWAADPIASLGELADAISKRQGALAALVEDRSSVQKLLENIDLDPKEAKKRAAAQKTLAELAQARLDQDRKINEAFAQVRELLVARQDLSAQMGDAASLSDFVLEGRDALDANRFDAMLANLPSDVAAASESWHQWFTGTRQDEKPYIVTDEILLVPETLAHCGVYEFGDEILLTEEEAGELAREDRPTPGALRNSLDAEADPKWKCAPPSVISREEWDAVNAEASASGIDVKEVLYWKHLARTAAIQQDPSKQLELSNGIYERAANFGKTMKRNCSSSYQVKIKATSQIRMTGKTLEEGESAVCDPNDARKLVDSGAAVRA